MGLFFSRGPQCGTVAVVPRPTLGHRCGARKSQQLRLARSLTCPRLPRTQPEKHAAYQFYVKVQTENECVWIQSVWAICCENTAARFIRICLHLGLWGKRSARQLQENGWYGVTFPTSFMFRHLEVMAVTTASVFTWQRAPSTQPVTNYQSQASVAGLHSIKL